MKQILQDLRSGNTLVEDVPAPAVRPGTLRIATGKTLVSAGTERMLVDFSRASLLEKARQQPERVVQALQKVRTDGLVPTLDAIRSKLEQPLALGYCNVGRVLETGRGVRDFAAGDRVVSNGKHAELVVVPQTLCARVPDNVDDESASFAVLGAIALQGIRLAAPTLGESVVVTGLGLVGLMSVQLLRASGCRVLGIDTDPRRLELARSFGAQTVDLSRGEDPVRAAATFARGRGVDAVVLTASTKSSEPVSQAAQMCRKRGRIVLVGVTGLDLQRADFYEKELTFQVSCSYGPGRYDPEYEEKGHDYPFGFVRWTEQRNLEAVLDMLSAGNLDVRPLVTHRFDIDDASRAYDVLASPEPSLGIVISYPDSATEAASGDGRVIQLRAAAAQPGPEQPKAGFIGAGNYAGRILLKAFKDAGASLQTVVSASGVSAAYYGKKFGFAHVGSEPDAVLDDPAVNVVCIATRHNTHAAFVRAALKRGKHVFVEKPLCLTVDELDAIAAEIEDAEVRGRRPLLMVGFNRRFAPLVVKAKSLLAPIRAPRSVVITVNAGAIPADHWTQDPEAGGGRIVGEGCHFIDLARHLVDAPITDFDIRGLSGPRGSGPCDTATITLGFADGSLGVVNYFANGHKAIPKERVEVFCAGRALVLDNYRKLVAKGFDGSSGASAWTQDKGQAACVAAFVEAVRTGGPAPIPVNEILEVSRVSIEAAQRL